MQVEKRAQVCPSALVGAAAAQREGGGMTPETEVNGRVSSQEGSADENPTEQVQPSIEELLAALRSSLGVPASERSGDWEGRVARLVGLVSTDFLGQGDDAVALQELAVLSLAAARGVKQAKKLSLSTNRWLRTPPPRISQVLTSSEESKCSLRLLSRIGADWVPGYVAAEVSAEGTEALRPELVQWALDSAPNVETVLRAFRAQAEVSAAQPVGWLSESLWLLARANRLVGKAMGTGFAAELARTAELLLAQPGGEGDVRKPTQAEVTDRQSALVALVDAATSLDPGLLVGPALTDTLRTAGSVSSPWPKPLHSTLSVITERAIHQYRLLLSVCSDETIRALAPVAKALREVLPEFDKHLSQATGDERGLGPLFRGEVPVVDPISDSNRAESVLTALLSEWDEYLAGSGEHPALRQLDSRIEALGQLYGVRKFGARGEAEEYRPLHHHLTEESAPPPTRVSIVKPGLVLVRRDGTERVLLRALVAPLG